MGHCVVKNAAGGGRWVEVPPERLVTWVVTFAQRHGGVTVDGPAASDETGAAVTFAAADGATAECHPPFPPVAAGVPADDGAGRRGVREVAEAVAAHAAAHRTVGVLLVRLGGYAAGVFTGSPPAGRRQDREPAGARPQRGGRLVAAPFRPAPGEAGQRGAAGGRGRGGRGVRPVGPDRLDAVVLGGDKRAVAELRDRDPRLAPYLAMATDGS